MKTYRQARKFSLATATALLLVQPSGALQAQETHAYTGGYARTVSGDTMTYASPISTARKALISRATDGRSSVTWETEAAAAEAATQPTTFLWLAGLGSNLGEKRFTIAADGNDVATFATSSLDSWEVAGQQGAHLAFQTVMVDRNRDHFGFMRLSLPAGMVQPGKPVELRITGEAAKSSAWVMTFTSAITDGVTASSRPVILREKERNWKSSMPAHPQPPR